MKEARKRRGTMDYWILLTVIGLTVFGIISIFSASMYSSGLEGSPFSYFIKQLIFAILGIIAMMYLANTDYRKIKKLAPVALIGVIFLLILVLFIGVNVNGARRWIDLKIGTIQPSEFTKIALILYLSYSLEKKRELLSSFKYGILPYFWIAVVVCGLIALEPNLSTATIIGALIMGMLLIGGVDLKWFLPVVGVGMVGVVYMIASTGWRVERMLTFLNPWADMSDSGWQITQSLMALGSGGLLGRGFGEGKAKLLFLPEPQNDFIFAHIGEEMGLICGVILIAVYLFLIWRCVALSLNAPDPFSMLFCGGMAGLLGMQVFINIGVATSLIPVTGMPLPFVSAGASSLISLMCGMGIVLSISRYCKV